MNGLVDPYTLEKGEYAIPQYIKEWYKTDGRKKGQTLKPHISLMLIDYALANGAVVPVNVVDTVTMPFEIPEAIAVPAKILWNEFGEMINEHGERIDVLGNVIEY